MTRKPILLRPDTRYRTKLYISALLIMLVSFGWLTVPLVYVAGYEQGGVGAGLLLTGGVHLLVLIVGLIFIPAYYNSIRYEIQADEVIVHSGILTKTVKHVPFRTVTNLQVTRGPLDRLFGIGALSIQTAGASGTRLPEEKLAGLLDVQGTYEFIAEELRRFRGAMSPTQADEELPMNTGGSLNGNQDVLLAILHELRAIREGMEQQT